MKGKCSSSKQRDHEKHKNYADEESLSFETS